MKKIFYQILSGLFIIAAIVVPAYGDEIDRSSVSLFDAPFTIRVSMQIPFILFCVKPQIRSDETDAEESIREGAHITYMPNLRLNGGFGLYYKSFGTSYVRKITTLSTNENSVKTEYTDIRLNEYYRKFGVDLIYMNYRGFILTDTQTNRSDIKLKTVSATGFYIFSDDFSLRAAFIQNEKQNKWDWTPIAVVSTVYQSLKSEYSIIPLENQSAFTDNAGLKYGIFRGGAIGAGFGITVPYSAFLFTAVSYFGSGYMHRSYITQYGNKVDRDGFYRINAKSSISYNTDSFFYGFTFVYDSIANYSGIRILTNTYTFEIFSGFRI